MGARTWLCLSATFCCYFALKNSYRKQQLAAFAERSLYIEYCDVLDYLI